MLSKPLEARSEPCQTSKIERLAKIVNGQKPLTIFAKNSILDVRQGFEYAYDLFLSFFNFFVLSIGINVNIHVGNTIRHFSLTDVIDSILSKTVGCRIRINQGVILKGQKGWEELLFSPIRVLLQGNSHFIGQREKREDVPTFFTTTFTHSRALIH